MVLQVIAQASLPQQHGHRVRPGVVGVSLGVNVASMTSRSRERTLGPAHTGDRGHLAGDLDLGLEAQRARGDD
jgi:hypothetical protein